MSFNVKGTLKVISDAIQVSDKFRKRDFVIEDNSSQYPQLISFQLVQDRCSLIDTVKVGDEINVHFNLRGREWKSPQGETKFFNTIEAWKIELISYAPLQQQTQPPQQNTTQTNSGNVVGSSNLNSELEDLPF